MFKTIPIRRGFTEIAPLYDLALKNNCIICGGYARYCASPLPTAKVKIASDVDLFPKSEEACNILLTDLKAVGYEIKYENHICYTLAPTETAKVKLQYIPTPQIIKPVVEGKIVTVGTVEELLDNFDFTIVRAAILSPTTVLVDEDFEQDEIHHILRLKNIHCPISSLLRCCKYARKGYFMRPAEALKLFNDWTARGEDYQKRLNELFAESTKGKVSDENPNGITQKEIDELEALLRID
jgi:hypothetical protein